MKTYVSLFSSAGVGCYGFKQEGFECVATNELIKRRLDVQRFNNKCKYDSGYICGDITTTETKKKLFAEIDLWKKHEGLKRLDVLIATPPCQGMSVANHKKTNTEIIRNSLVVESINIIKQLKPRFFIFENVPAFMKTLCTDNDGRDKPIEEAIRLNLGDSYSYFHKVINFKNYGACSSRQRTVVIGVANDLADEISPLELFPSYKKEKTLRDVIGSLPSLNTIGEISPDDIYHQFRPYPEHMRSWISGLKEGESAFDNKDISKRPHQIKDGMIVVNQQKNADKYKRQYWDRVGPCVHTRNDQLASQNTVHPSDDRVFSIRELMRMMTVPSSFMWSEHDLHYLNLLSTSEKRAFLKKEEIKIRQSLGEAVPTIIFQEIAKNISEALSHPVLTATKLNILLTEYELTDPEHLIEFIKQNPLDLSVAALGRIAEMANTKRSDNAAYFTSKSLVTEIVKRLPAFESDTISILEPSVGVGNFIPLIARKYETKEISLDVVDIDATNIEILRLLVDKFNLPENCHINYIVDDFLLHKFHKNYDLVVGNPPFYKLTAKESKLLQQYKKDARNQDTSNICSFFLEKSLGFSNFTCLILPKFLLNTPEFAKTRELLSDLNVETIIDFGEKGFPGVLVETVAIFINNVSKPKNTLVSSLTQNIELVQKQRYIFDKALPYWVIFRNEFFDNILCRLELGVFNVFRDRQITNTHLACNCATSMLRVLRSRNITDNGIVDISGYDTYIDKDFAKNLAVFKFLNENNVYLTPNMTYNPRVVRKPSGVLVNGSVAILSPKSGVLPTQKQLDFFASPAYRKFYQIARNYQTRSLNVDSCSVYFYGLLKND